MNSWLKRGNSIKSLSKDTKTRCNLGKSQKPKEMIIKQQEMMKRVEGVKQKGGSRGEASGMSSDGKTIDTEYLSQLLHN